VNSDDQREKKKISARVANYFKDFSAFLAEKFGR
jgi:hypothetical protein